MQRLISVDAKIDEALGFRRESVVGRNRLQDGGDFKLESDKDKVANYSPTVVQEVLDDRDSPTVKSLEALRKCSYTMLKQNLFANTYIILAIYFCSWLLVNFVFVQFPQSIFRRNVLCANGTVNGVLTYLDDTSATSKEPCGDLIRDKLVTFVKEWGEHEKEMKKVLFLLIGFYVKMIVGRWRKQSSQLPTMEEVCQAINGFVLHKDEEKQNKFQRKILRYCLLSWTMCLTSVSSCFEKEFKEKQKYIEKGLLTETEYNALTNNNGSQEDGGGWTDKWHIPLGWATLLCNDGAVGEDVYIKKEHKFVSKAILGIQKNLEGIIEHFHNPIPQIMTQAVTIACWVLLICSVVSGQEAQDIQRAGEVPLGIRFSYLVFDFPYLHAVVLLLLFAWLRVGMCLQNPFEYDDGFGINLKKRLDFEIWKASYMTSKSYTPASLTHY